jgi:hypothetical protein
VSPFQGFCINSPGTQQRDHSLADFLTLLAVNNNLSNTLHY